VRYHVTEATRDQLRTGIDARHIADSEFLEVQSGREGHSRRGGPLSLAGLNLLCFGVRFARGQNCKPGPSPGHYRLGKFKFRSAAIIVSVIRPRFVRTVEYWYI